MWQERNVTTAMQTHGNEAVPFYPAAYPGTSGGYAANQNPWACFLLNQCRSASIRCISATSWWRLYRSTGLVGNYFRRGFQNRAHLWGTPDRDTTIEEMPVFGPNV